MSSKPAAQLVGQVVGAYQLVRVLGEGGMGTVYEGLHPSLGRRAAIKVMHPEHTQNPELLSRFFNEARAVNIVQHPSLVNIYEFGTTPDGIAYIVMEYLDGESLRTRLRRVGGKLGLAALPIARQVANALAATHEKQIVHRDLKPDNIMLVPDAELPEGERAKILDFGIAKLAGGDGAEALKVRTKTGAMLGTPTYMSPEQCRGVGLIDGRTDVYALGVILFELLAGQTPFESDGFGELIGMHMFMPPPPLAPLAPSTPPELLTLVARMLAKTPAERPSMAEAAATLTRLGRSVSTATQAMPAISAGLAPVGVERATANTTIGSASGQSALVTPRRHKLGLVAAGGVLLVVGSGVLWSQLRDSRVPPGALPQTAVRAGAATAATPTPTVNGKADPATAANPTPAVNGRADPATSGKADPAQPVPPRSTPESPAVTRATTATRSAASGPAARCQSLFKRGRFADAVTACTAALASDLAQPEVQRTLRAAQDAAAVPKPAVSPKSSPTANPSRKYEKVKALD